MKNYGPQSGNIMSEGSSGSEAINCSSEGLSSRSTARNSSDEIPDPIFKKGRLKKYETGIELCEAFERASKKVKAPWR